MLRVGRVFGVLRMGRMFRMIGVPILRLLRELPIRRLLLLPLPVTPGQPGRAAQGMLLDLHGPILARSPSTPRAAAFYASRIRIANERPTKNERPLRSAHLDAARA